MSLAQRKKRPKRKMTACIWYVVYGYIYYNLSSHDPMLQEGQCDGCRKGGKMVPCTTCDRLWHLRCAKLKEFPKDYKWSCEMCVSICTKESSILQQGLLLIRVQTMYTCDICSTMELDEKKQKELINCSKCDAYYHPECLNIKKPGKNWLCADCVR